MTHLKRYYNIIRKRKRIIPKALRGYALSAFRKRGVFRGAELAVTYDCQAGCPKCSCRSLIDDKRSELSTPEIIKIADEMVANKGILVDLTGGEPLLRKDIVEIVGQLARKPILVSMATNAIGMTPDLMRTLADAGLSVLQFGLASPISEEHDAEVGCKGAFDNIMRSIESANQNGISVLLNVVMTKDILHTERLEILETIAKETGSYISLIYPAPVGGWEGNDTVRLGEADYERINELLKKDYFTTDTVSSYKKGKCPAGSEKIYISPYGDVYPCPFIQQPFGNLRDYSLKKILKNMQAVDHKRCVNIRR